MFCLDYLLWLIAKVIHHCVAEYQLEIV